MGEISAIDLVVPTLGRTTELTRFLESVAAQTWDGRSRILLVDQNPDDRVARAAAGFEITRLESVPGLSRARNAALPHLGGDIVAFPDDDCWYPPALLEEVVAALDAHPEWGGLSVQVRDSQSRPSSMLWDTSSGPIDRYNIWRRAISVGLFLRRSTVSAAGDFAEELGLGAGTRWGSGEESDFVLRAMAAGCVIHYEPSLFVHHEWPRVQGGAEARRAAYGRGLGHGEVLRRHGYPFWFAAFRVLQLAGGAATFLVRGRRAEARYYFAMSRGRARGWLGS